MNKKLTQKQIEYFKNHFLKQKEVIIFFCHKKQADSEIDLDGDEIDAIQARILHATNAAIVEREAKKLLKIDSALSKIDNGTFGFCEDCDELIAIKRLEARPEAEFCILCAEKSEQEAKMFLAKKS